jgi:hypothetical protein
MQPSSHDLAGAVDRWVAAGIITNEQAERIRADLAAHTPRRGSLVAEALGYLGGVIVLVGLVLVLGLSWERLDTTGRVAVVGGTALALIVAGFPIPVSRLGATGTRLRGVLWTMATAGTAGTLGLVGSEVLEWDTEQTMLLWSAGAAAVSAALWALNRHILQHVTTFAALLFAAFWAGDTLVEGAELERSSAVLTWVVPGAAVWLTGAVWFALGLLRVLPRGGAVLGAMGLVIGGLCLLRDEWGPLFGLATVIALVVVAVARRELAVLAVGSVGTLIMLPFAVDQYLPGGVFSTALALILAGLALVATGVYTARRRREGHPAPTG